MLIIIYSTSNSVKFKKGKTKEATFMREKRYLYSFVWENDMEEKKKAKPEELKRVCLSVSAVTVFYSLITVPEVLGLFIFSSWKI